MSTATHNQIGYMRNLLLWKEVPDWLRKETEMVLNRDQVSAKDASRLIPLLKDLPSAGEQPKVASSDTFIPEPTVEEMEAQRQIGRDFSSGLRKHVEQTLREEPRRLGSPYDIRLALAQVINDAQGTHVPVATLRQIIARANQAEQEGAVVYD
jgi:hypothetical protein